MNDTGREYHSSMKKIILFHHLPLSLVDSKYLKDGMTLPCRQTFTKHIKEYTDKTREAIKRLIEVGTNYSVTFDGFQNKSCKRFIDVDLNFFAYRRFRHVAMAHKEVIAIHETSYKFWIHIIWLENCTLLQLMVETTLAVELTSWIHSLMEINRYHIDYVAAIAWRIFDRYSKTTVQLRKIISIHCFLHRKGIAIDYHPIIQQCPLELNLQYVK